MAAKRRTQSDELSAEIRRLIEAMMNGQLDARVDVSRFSGEQADLMALLNQMLDVLIRPMRVTAKYIDEIAHGVLPEFILDEYQGEYNQIKRNLNTLLAIMYGMHHETQNLIQSVQEGKLNTRGNDWDYEGNWEKLIGGVNDTLDAVVEPVQAANSVLARLSEYDLTAQMTGQYQGEHNQIKKALNTTGSTLHSAITQVAESVSAVSAAVSQISSTSREVTEGAGLQATTLDQTARKMEQIAGICRKNAEIARQTQDSAQHANEAVQTGDEAAGKMIRAMEDICEAAQASAGILEEINSFSAQTKIIAEDAARKAEKVGASARGFAVVANEVRTLSKHTTEAASKITQLIEVNAAHFASKEQSGELFETNRLKKIVDEIHGIAIKSNMLALNASVEAAHVGEAALEFGKFTEEVHGISQHSKDAAAKTQAFVGRSMERAQNGRGLSQQIDSTLTQIADEVRKVTTLIDQVAASSQDQAHEVETVNQSVGVVKEVTQQNAENAQELLQAAQGLEAQMDKLHTMVKRFKLDKTTDSLPAPVGA